MKLNKFILEGVSHVIATALKSPALIKNAQIDYVIQETITSFPPYSWEAKKISRSKNFYALYVAYSCSKGHPGLHSLLNFSPSSIPICSGKDPPFLTPLRFGFLVFWHATCWSAGCFTCSSLSCCLAVL